MRRIAAFLLALCLLLGAACAQEEVLAPAYPVPDYVKSLLAVAKGELGYLERSDGYSKYGEWAGDPYAQWCAEFLCWCVYQVDEQQGLSLLNTQYPFYSGSNTGRNWFLQQGRYIARSGYVEGWGSQWYKGEEERMPADSYIPQPGDWVFFSVNGTDTSHVAMVDHCAQQEDGSLWMYVYEGNMPDRVQLTAYSLTNPRILGYGTVRDLADIVLTSASKGKKVEQLQIYLNGLGYLSAQYITGEYGPSTAQAVRAFQEATGKTPTGIANHHTQLALSALYWQQYWQNDAFFLVSETEREE